MTHTATTDRDQYLAYSRAAHKLHEMARSFVIRSEQVDADPELVTFAAPVAGALVRSYEQLAEHLTTAALQATEVADSYRAHFVGDVA